MDIIIVSTEVQGEPVEQPYVKITAWSIRHRALLCLTHTKIVLIIFMLVWGSHLAVYRTQGSLLAVFVGLIVLMESNLD